jgi:hypothetical protein
LPHRNEQLDRFACLGAEARHFLLRQQFVKLHGRQLLHSGRSTQIVERVTEFSIPLLHQHEDRQVTLVAVLVEIGSKAIDLGKDALAKAFERDRVELALEFPIRLTNDLRLEKNPPSLGTRAPRPGPLRFASMIPEIGTRRAG